MPAALSIRILLSVMTLFCGSLTLMFAFLTLHWPNYRSRRRICDASIARGQKGGGASERGFSRKTALLIWNLGGGCLSLPIHPSLSAPPNQPPGRGIFQDFMARHSAQVYRKSFNIILNYKLYYLNSLVLFATTYGLSFYTIALFFCSCFVLL